MTEKIGNITLDLTWYQGEDLYSDGPVEQKLLQIAKNCRPEQINEVIAREKSWPVLYHMSPIRENIVRSLPITKKDRVLEIGAGPGAITGQLAAMAGSVTCIDLSRQRSLINAYRHSDMDNVRILVGNFQDIEPHLSEKYDWITLIGVLEYAGLYIDGAETDGISPCRLFLQKVRRHLGEDGTLVTAIENRLGLKYWAGCREDHTGHYFEGLEDYPDPGAKVHTFSRPELEGLMRSAGLPVSRFYYPYPDYKLPEQIFSDDYLPGRGELTDNLRNFDRDRMMLFDEAAVFDSLTSSGLFPEFSNSFLVLSRMKPAGERSRLLYAKYSVQRSPEYAIRTDIVQAQDGTRAVEKTAIWPQGSAHIERIRRSGAQLARLLADTGVAVNAVLPGPEAQGGDTRLACVRLAYAGGTGNDRKTLESELTSLWKKGDRESAGALLHTWTDRISGKAAEPFHVTADFSHVFGLKEYGWEDRTLPVTDLDMIPENVLLSADGTWTLIDYEWTVEFPVPVRFVLWRAVHYFFAGLTKDQTPLSWYLEEGFSAEEVERFHHMESAWQAYVRKGTEDLQDLYAQMSPGVTYPAEELRPGEEALGTSYLGSLSWNEGSGPVSVSVPFKAAEDGTFTAQLPVGRCAGMAQAGSGPAGTGSPGGADHAADAGSAAGIGGTTSAPDCPRWNPLNTLARIRILSIDAPCGVIFHPVNGFETPEGVEFWTRDPVYELRGIAPGTEQITVHASVEKISLYNELPALNQIRRERDADQAEMERLRAHIRAEEGTKGFRVLEKLRSFRNFCMARIRGTKLFSDKTAPEKAYQLWLKAHLADAEQLQAQRMTNLPVQPKISVLVPVYRTPERYLKAMVESVLSQTYPNWELCIADGSCDEGKTAALLEPYAKADPRIRLKVLTENAGISGNTNQAAGLATGDYLCFLDHDDMLAPEALFEAASAIAQTGADLLYSDEDKVNEEGTAHFSPNLKPDFSPDLLRSHNYITHLLIVKRSLYDQVGPLRSEFDGAQDYDLTLRCTEKAQKIWHIRKILYFWRSHPDSTAENPESKEYAYDAGRRAIQAHLDRLGVPAQVSRTKYWGLYHVSYAVPEDAFVSIIIPNMDHIRDLDRCIASIEKKSAFRKFEILVIENNSRRKRTARYYEQVQKRYDNVRVLRWPGKGFNYSAINNFGAAQARGSYLLLLNNDTELLEPGSLAEMAGICSRPEVGCVGAKLLYKDGTVQHAGIITGPGGFAGHVFSGIDRESPGFMMRPLITCNYSAVTGACLMVRREVYEACGGLDETFPVALNDVDFCLRLRGKGYLVVYTPFSLWHHYESRSRGYEDTPEKKARFERDIAAFRARWAGVADGTDPYYHPYFLKDRTPFSLY